MLALRLPLRVHFSAWIVVVALSTLLASTSSASPISPRSDHPRLFFTAERIAKLKERFATEPSIAESWKAILASADQSVEKHDNSLKNGEALALAFRITGDKRYADCLREALRHEIQRPGWGEADLLRRDPSWHAGLGLARTLYAAAFAFDAIHDALSANDRQEIAKGIVELGIRPTLDDWMSADSRIHSLDTMGHNWWSACVFVAGIGSLAVIDEEPQAAGWLERINEASVEWFGYAGSVIENKPASFDREGAFFESVNYASFGISQYLLFRLAWTNAVRSPAAASIPILDRVGEFFLHSSYPNRDALMSLNFGDSGIHTDGSRPVGLLWALGIHRPEYAWYLAATKSLSFREGLNRTSALGLLYFPNENELASAPTTPPLRPSNAYSDIGWATLRSSWQADATLLAVRAGYTWNHAHADAASFVLFHQGKYLLIDPGTCSYSRKEYDEFYRQSLAHNVVLFNGQAENPEDTYSGSKFSGSVSHLIDTGDLKYVLADATGPTSHVFNRNYRHLLWIGDVILVIDDVDAFQPGQFEWLLHVGGKAERHGLDLQVVDGNASVLVRPLFPATFPDAGLPTDYPECMRLVEKIGLQEHEPDTKVTYYSFAPPEQTRRTKFITAITLVSPTNQDRLPKIDRIQNGDTLGVRIHQGETITTVYLNLRADGRIRHRNANNLIGGWETDAYLFALTYHNGANENDPDAAARVFIADGSYLRRDKKVVLDSLSKVFTTWARRDGALDVVLQGQPNITAYLRIPAKPARIDVNGATTEAPYDAATQLAKLTIHP